MQSTMLKLPVAFTPPVGEEIEVTVKGFVRAVDDLDGQTWALLEVVDPIMGMDGDGIESVISRSVGPRDPLTIRAEFRGS